MKGVYTALVTPFDEENKVCFEDLGRIIELQVEAGVEGVLVLGSTGEWTLVSQVERNQIIEFCLNKVSGRVKTMIGCSAFSTPESVNWTEHAKILGADCVMVTTPPYSRPSQEGIISHLKEINKVGIPVVLYENAARTGSSFQPDTVVEIFKSCEQVCAIKDASGNLMTSMEYRLACPEITLFAAGDSLTVPMIAIGAKGVLSVWANLFPLEILEIMQLMEKEKLKDAEEANFNLLKILTSIQSQGENPVSLKAAMKIKGILSTDRVRPPLAGHSPAALQQIQNLLTDDQ